MANLMDLVRELKALNAKKKSGTALTPEEKERRSALKDYLKSAMDNPPTSTEGAPVDSPSDELPLPPVTAPSGEASSPDKGALPSPFSAAPQPISMEGAFAIDANNLFDEAMASPLQNVAPEKSSNSQRSASNGQTPQSDFRRISADELSDVERKAEEAARANKKRKRAFDPASVQKQLKEIGTTSRFMPSASDIVQEQYYSSYYDDGFDPLAASTLVTALPTQDSREIPLNAFSLEHPLAKYPPEGLAFLDDFPILYKRKILAPPGEEELADIEDPNLFVKGTRKVTLHLTNGRTLRGSIDSLARDTLGFIITSNGKKMEFAFSQTMALFVHLKSGTQSEARGKSIKVVFSDGRGVKGYSDESDNNTTFLSVVPASKYERIIVPRTAVKQVLPL